MSSADWPSPTGPERSAGRDEPMVDLQASLERSGELSTRIRLGDTARWILRQASGGSALSYVLEISRPALLEGFQALGMWLQTFDEDGLGKAEIYSADGQNLEFSETVHTIAYNVAHALWVQQETLVLDADGRTELLADHEAQHVEQLLAELEVGSILFVPLGAGPECLGNLVLTRAIDAPAWTATEAAAALEVGRDLGAAILNVRAYERQHRLVLELQALDTYKSQLIATVSHELKNPLTSVLGHLEMLESIEDLPGPARRSLDAMERGVRRLGRVVDDLLLLAKVGNPDTPVIACPVDLRAVVDDVIALYAVEAQRRHLTVTITAPGITDGYQGQVVASADRDEIDRVVSNLVSNAIKYTPDGGHITVSLTRHGDQVELVCADNGFGISAADQKQLFTEFFRSSNPVAVAQPGTGLGLAIVRRVMERHRGQITVESDLGKGSTFRVTLPAA